MLLAEQLVGEARERRRRQMSRRERLLNAVSATCFLAVALAFVLVLPDERAVDPLLILGLVAGYAIVSRVRFEFGSMYVTPEQLMFVPMLLLAPLPYVPLLVIVSALLSQLPDFLERSWHRDRWVSCFADSWFCVGPVIVVALLAPGEPEIGLFGVYAARLRGADRLRLRLDDAQRPRARPARRRPPRPVHRDLAQLRRRRPVRRDADPGRDRRRDPRGGRAVGAAGDRAASS